MTDDNDPLRNDGYLCCLRVSGNPRGMEQHGPNLGVSISGVTADGNPLAAHEGSAIIDTGAETSCIAPRMVPIMQGALEGTRNISNVFGRVEGEKTLRGLVQFANKKQFIRDFAVLQHLDDYDVIIGRDILRHCRFYMDLSKGHFRLYFTDDISSSSDGS